MSYTVKPVYKGHSREPGNVVSLWAVVLYIQDTIIWTIHWWTKIRLLFIDSDLFYKGSLQGMFDCDSLCHSNWEYLKELFVYFASNMLLHTCISFCILKITLIAMDSFFTLWSLRITVMCINKKALVSQLSNLKPIRQFALLVAKYVFSTDCNLLWSRNTISSN